MEKEVRRTRRCDTNYSNYNAETHNSHNDSNIRRRHINGLRKMASMRGLALAILTLTLVLELLTSGHMAEARVINKRSLSQITQRLCSSRLSDTMRLVCQDSGYNSPLSGDGPDSNHQAGPGLVQECCYNTCSVQQMQQYCKPDKASG